MPLPPPAVGGMEILRRLVRNILPVIELRGVGPSPLRGPSLFALMTEDAAFFHLCPGLWSKWVELLLFFATSPATLLY